LPIALAANFLAASKSIGSALAAAQKKHKIPIKNNLIMFLTNLTIYNYSISTKIALKTTEIATNAISL
jgi:hypothetical protein